MMTVDHAVAALRAELGEAAAGTVDAAVLEYMAQMLVDTSMLRAEMKEAVGPLLLDTGCVDEGEGEGERGRVAHLTFQRTADATDAFVDRVLQRLHGDSHKDNTNGAGLGKNGGDGEGKTESAVDDAPRLLQAPVILLERVKQFEQSIGSLLKLELNLKEDLFTNKLIDTFASGDEVLDEASMKQKAKMEKKLEKQEKRGINRERGVAAERNEIMEQLTRAPIVLHPGGEFGSYFGSGGGQTDIILTNVGMELGGLVMLESCNLTLAYGRRYGLVGRNGIGKTTFLKYIAAKAFPGIPAHLQILHIEQEVNGTDVSVLQTVLNCDIEREQLLSEEREQMSKGDDGDGIRLAEIYRRLEEIDASSAVSRASAILSGLGFTPEMQQRPTKEFSGGWRMRVSLALALFIQPDVLLLDEPTNHLSEKAVIWLEDYLINWKKTLLIVSHARDFLDNVVTDILHLQNKNITRYKGNYNNFEERREEELKLNQKAIENQDKQIAHMQAFVDRFRVSAARASMAQSRLKAIAKIERVASMYVDPEIQFNFPEPESLGANATAQLIDVAFAYSSDSPTLFSGVDMTIGLSSRICLVGENGMGKSTLLKIIYGELQPTSGIVTKSNRLRVERFSQHHVDQLNMKKSALESFRTDWPTDPVQKIRAHLGAMGITGKLALQPIYTLSGGQKSRVALAKITYSQPHILLLDEITNHLDMAAIQALIAALATWTGGVFLISHDEHMISAVCDELWVVQDRKIIKWPGDFEHYKRHVKKEMGLTAR